MIRDILVNLSVESERDVARDYALSLAQTFQAHVTGTAFACLTIVPGIVFDGVPAGLIAAQREESERAANSAAVKFDEAVRKAALSADSRIIQASLTDCAQTFGRLARIYDLAVVSQPKPDSTTPDDLVVEAALFESGRPTLVVPYIQSQPFKIDRVLLCWDGSRNAARAIADALPILEKSKAIEIITITPKDNQRGEIPGVDMAHHLARYRLKVDLKRIVAPDTDVPNTILSHAADTSADLIVMGGYGHSRLREFVLGGATRGILESMTVPTLMSH